MATEKQAEEAMRQIIFYPDNSAPDVHKTFSPELGWCFLSDAHGNRYKITYSWKLSDVDRIVNKIRQSHELRQ